jgi:acarbose 7IV-phosphotransferase
MASDAVLSCFLHFYWDGEEALAALQKAVVFAGYKVGESGGARGFLSEKELFNLLRRPKSEDGRG